MAVMRSIFYVPGNNPKFIEKAPTIPADIITLDLEDAVPPSEKENARKMIVENMHKIAKESVSGAEIYVRINGNRLRENLHAAGNGQGHHERL